MGRDKLVASLKEISSRRTALIDNVDVKEIWEILNTEQEWIDLPTMTGFCFSGEPTKDHESAVFRAFFNDRHYFKFNGDRFFPLTEEQITRLENRKKEAEQLARFPQRCMRSDRLSALSQWDLGKEDALREEFRRGLEVIRSGETEAGAGRFASGAGRHGEGL